MKNYNLRPARCRLFVLESARFVPSELCYGTNKKRAYRPRAEHRSLLQLPKNLLKINIMVDFSKSILKLGNCTLQGWLTTMEDAHTAELDIDGKNSAFFGVFDGQ